MRNLLQRSAVRPGRMFGFLLTLAVIGFSSDMASAQ